MLAFTLVVAVLSTVAAELGAVSGLEGHVLNGRILSLRRVRRRHDRSCAVKRLAALRSQ